MKSENEITRAHDLLVAVILGEVPIDVGNETDEACMRSACDVLCWMLGHDHNTHFQSNLDAINEAAHKLGYVLEKMPVAQKRGLIH